MHSKNACAIGISEENKNQLSRGAYKSNPNREKAEEQKLSEEERNSLKAEKAILDEAKAGVEQEQANMEALIDQKNRDITAYESDITNKEQAIK